MPMKQVYFENYGCPSNRFDLDVMMQFLDRAGCIIVESPRAAEVLILNTCGVKKVTEDKILSRLRFLNELEKPIIVTGCLPKIDLQALERAVPNGLTVLDPFSIDKICEAVEGIQSGHTNQYFFSTEAKVKLRMPKRRDGVYEIVPISEGCLGSCAFCCTRLARGRLFSYPLEAVVGIVNDLVCDGVREIWLTAQDTGAYGLDMGCDLAHLLMETCNIEGEFLLRVGMMNPYNVLNMLDRLVEAYKNTKVFKFLHLPVQSGNDTVLKLMNRFYTISDFKRIVNTFRKAIPDITLSTDIICGFPGEDAAAFEDSLMLIKEVEPDIVNISKFSPRPKTAASGTKQLPSQTVKMRSKKMVTLCQAVSLKRNMCWVDWRGEVFIDEIGKESTMVGRNFAYKPVIIEGDASFLGRNIKIRVREATPTYLIGDKLSY